MKCPHCNGTGELHPDAVSVGTMILSHRNALKMTQLEVSEKVGRSRSQIANIELGNSDIPVSLLKRLADTFGVSMKDLIP